MNAQTDERRTPVTELTWTETYDHACRSFGDTTPSPQLEESITAHFRKHPAAVIAAIDKLAARYEKGTIHTPWPLVLRELQREDEREKVTARIDTERDKAITLAETYIRNAGLYLPTETELLDALFGPHGNLKTWATDEELRYRMTELWRTNQPRAEQSNREMLERAARYRAGKQPEETIFP